MNAKKINAVITSVAAILNIPYINNHTFSTDVDNYRNSSAVAIGIQYKRKGPPRVRTSYSWNNTDGTVIGGGIARRMVIQPALYACDIS
ncbi:predicted protein [Escherichia albertii]|nr:predicted protein [Escherichia albertii]